MSGRLRFTIAISAKYPLNVNPVTKLQNKGDSNKKVDLLFLAEGYTADEAELFYQDAQTAMEEVGAVVEGYYAAKAAYALGQREGIDMPITEAAYKVLYEGADARETFQSLMIRRRKSESEDAGWL